MELDAIVEPVRLADVTFELKHVVVFRRVLADVVDLGNLDVFTVPQVGRIFVQPFIDCGGKEVI